MDKLGRRRRGWRRNHSSLSVVSLLLPPTTNTLPRLLPQNGLKVPVKSFCVFKISAKNPPVEHQLLEKDLAIINVCADLVHIHLNENCMTARNVE